MTEDDFDSFWMAMPPQAFFGQVFAARDNDRAYSMRRLRFRRSGRLFAPLRGSDGSSAEVYALRRRFS